MKDISNFVFNMSWKLLKVMPVIFFNNKSWIVEHPDSFSYQEIVVFKGLNI